MVVNLKYHQTFIKHYEKRIATNANLNPFHPLLRNHALSGKKHGLRAFSVTGDIRVVYRPIDEQTVELLDIGSHTQVY